MLFRSVLAFFWGNLAVAMLHHYKVSGFVAYDDIGSVLLATLSFQGAAIVGGILFLKFHEISWREISGLDTARWQRQLGLVIGALLIALPVMFSLKLISELMMEKLGWPVTDQKAVEMIFQAKSTGLKIYMGFFAVVLAPLAEEFVFRGLIFSGLKKMGWPKCAWLGSSLLFALIHGSAPIFLPLFVFALALAWLCEKTEGLLAPIAAHSLFNAANLAILLLQT